MSIEAMKLALEALEAVSKEMTVGERYTNAGQQVLDAIDHLRVATTQQPATGEPVAWMASYVDPVGNDHVYVTSHHDLAVENDMHGTPRPLYTHPAPSVPMTERELELIDGMVAVQLDHAQRCDAISNRVMAEKQKGWDMERVELLRRIRSLGITAHAQKGTNGEIS